MSDYIPNELLPEILVRLPVQSLIRFASVCKTWYSLITSPSFITKHLNRSKANTESLLLKAYSFEDNKECYLLCCGDGKFGDKFSEVESPFGTPFGHNRIVGSCNGLVCMLGANIIVWNPSTRKAVTLPMPSSCQTSPHSYLLGFGAHPLTYEYMLVYIVHKVVDLERRKFPSKVELYTQGAGSWRCVTCIGHPHHIVHFDCFQAFVNGAIHWIAFDRKAMDGFRSLIMMFNTGSQAFSVMMMPPALINQNSFRLSVMSYGESLAVLDRGKAVEGSCCIWVMKEYGVAESWAKLYNINLPGVLRNIIGLRKNGEILLSTSENQLLCYDSETKTLTYSGYTGSSGAFDAYTSMESLVSVEPGNGVFGGQFVLW